MLSAQLVPPSELFVAPFAPLSVRNRPRPALNRDSRLILEPEPRRSILSVDSLGFELITGCRRIRKPIFRQERKESGVRTTPSSDPLYPDTTLPQHIEWWLCTR